LGGGLALHYDHGPLRPALDQVLAEFRSSHPERTIEATFALAQPVRLRQRPRAQLLSNLLGNALTHGAPDQPVRVDARADHESFALSVANAGEPISGGRQGAPVPAVLSRPREPSLQGLGLGLYIVAEIARAHGGTVDVESSAEQTRFYVPNAVARYVGWAHQGVYARLRGLRARSLAPCPREVAR